jgi:predicted ArsR family transcriptional regulator
VLLHDCPFREVAQHHQEVVCSLHLGLMRGALDRMRAPLTVDRLEPFASPGVCVTHLAAPRERERPGERADLGALPEQI